MRGGLVVILTQKEINEADLLLRKITDNNSKCNRVFRIDRAVAMDNAQQLKLDGFRAEKAVSKGLKLKWNSCVYSEEEYLDKQHRATDVAGLEVKCTRWKSGCLVIKPTDLVSATYVLVIVQNECTYILKGWCEGKDGMKDEFLKPGTYGQPAFYVPQENLKPIDSLITKLDNFI